VSQPLPAVVAPTLDDAQQAVVRTVGTPGHGPLLVLAGPGTGKTTTLVEAVCARVESGTAPDRILTLTFSRRAAGELRDRIAARLGRTVEAQSAWTFHAFAYALAGETRPSEDHGRPLRLLSGPEQDVVVRELLAGDRADGLRQWPEELAVALGTRGFADEVRTLLARARGFGLEPPDLAQFATEAGARADWRAAARFLEQYLEVLDQLGALDYAELVHRAVVHAESASGRAALRARYDLVVVDEYQDTDPAQERLLTAIAGDGRDLVVVGDPDQSIYSFRGAEVRGLLDFRTRFLTSAGDPAAVASLRVSRRAGAELLAASRAVARRMPLAGGGLTDALRQHRALAPADGLPAGEVDVWTYPSPSAQLDAVADVLRRAHLDDGLPWSQMAVLVRSGVRSLPYLRRVLGASGVPVEVASDELPLAREPAVTPLLLALRVVAEPDLLTQEAAADLLLSPLGGMDASGLRRLGRLLRDEERETSAALLPRPSAELIREVLAEPERLVALDDTIVGPASRLAALLSEAREVSRADGSAYDVLWSLWNGTVLPRRLERTSWAGGPAGRLADRDLDAVVALFEAASRFEDRTERRGVRTFLEELEAQQIPADTLAERALRGDAVRLLTAHRSKGLEWHLVVVIDVQEDGWPDLRRRGSLLDAEQLTSDGHAPPPAPAERLAEERRMFYVAVTRARNRLVVTAVDSPEDDGSRPSRFVAELGVPVVPVAERPRRPLTLTALVAELRATAADAGVDEAMRRAAALRLAQLASATADDGTPLVPGAHPDQWWGLADLSDPQHPLHPEGAPIRLSGSSLSGLLDCPLRWFLEHEAKAATARSTALGFGSVVHTLADDVAKGTSPAEIEPLMLLLDRVWDALAFEARWQSVRQRVEARKALERFLTWHTEDRGRTLVASEHPFTVSLAVGDREVVLRGSMDRVEVDRDGLVHVVDLKTGKSVPSGPKVAEHPQLGVYQVAVREGAVAELEGLADSVSGGAELVQLRAGSKGGRPKVQGQSPLPVHEDGTTDVDRHLAEAVRTMTAEEFPPTPGDACSYCQFKASCPARDEGRQVVR
jgi:superfamily I DNA/RNA helicase/RecB family exonuclease